MIDGHALYLERHARIQKAIALEPVDRIPFVFMATAFAPRYFDGINRLAVGQRHAVSEDVEPVCVSLLPGHGYAARRE